MYKLKWNIVFFHQTRKNKDGIKLERAFLPSRESWVTTRDHGDWDVEKRSSSNSMTFIVYIFNIEDHTHYIDAVTHRTIDGILFLSSTTSTWFVHPLNNSFVDKQVRKFILYQNIDFDMSWLQCVSFSHIFTLWFSTYVRPFFVQQLMMGCVRIRNTNKKFWFFFAFKHYWLLIYVYVMIRQLKSYLYLHSNHFQQWKLFIIDLFTIKIHLVSCDTKISDDKIKQNNTQREKSETFKPKQPTAMWIVGTEATHHYHYMFFLSLFLYAK